eukprot:SAG31_NODE_2139_length_6349_cov_2.773636_6_plen_109_part_00
MGMEHILVKRDEILAKKQGKHGKGALKDSVSDECRRCREAARHMQREFDLEEIRYPKYPNYPNDPNDPSHPKHPDDRNDRNDRNDPNHPKYPNDPKYPNGPNDPNDPN